MRAAACTSSRLRMPAVAVCALIVAASTAALTPK